MSFIRILILSFCSMCYELLLARTLAETTNHHILSYSISFGFFLLGMGIGSGVYGKYFNSIPPLKTFFQIESLIAFLGGLSVFLIFSLLSIYLILIEPYDFYNLRNELINYLFIFITQFLIFLIGFLSGFELPICLKIFQQKKTSFLFESEGILLGASYIGGFFGSLAVTLIMVPIFGLITSCILIGLVNIVVLLETLISHKKMSLKKPLFLLSLTLILFMAGSLEKNLMQFYLKSWYSNISLYNLQLQNIKKIMGFYKKLPEVLRIRSPYQNIDILSKTFNEYRFSIYREGMSLYLNKQAQFSENSWKTYHESMVVAGVHLSKTEPKQILILGGGDGLLSSKILELYKNIQTIDLVEIDPEMIKLAQTYLPLVQLNKNALKNKKVSIIIADAFRYISRSKKIYDAVFIDFPFPKTFGLSRLYSIEFYIKIKSILAPKGFVILNVPIWKSMENKKLNKKPMPQDILYSTLHYAGYKTYFAFGKNEPFLFLQTEKREDIGFRLNQNRFPVTKETIKNLVSISNILTDVEIKPKYINSVFKPQHFRY